MSNILKKKVFKKFIFRGFDIENLTLLSSDNLSKIVNSRARRKFYRGFRQKFMIFLRNLRKAKKDSKHDNRDNIVRTHLRDALIVPEMFGSHVEIYNGKTFNQIEIKPDMMSHYTGEFSITYKPVKHGKPGVGATSASKFVPLK